MLDFFTLTAMEQEALFLSFWVSCWSVAISLPFGIAVAWLLARFSFPGKTLLDGIIHLPLVTPPVVMGYLLLVMLGKNGILGKPLYEYLGLTFAFSRQGAILAAAVMAFPLLVRAVRLSFESADRGVEAAARTLGAGPFAVFLTISLPMALPGIITGAVLCFARSLGEFGATITFVSNIPGATQTLPLALYTLTQTPDGEAGALRLCCFSIAIAVAALVFSNYAAKKFSRKVSG